MSQELAKKQPQHPVLQKLEVSWDRVRDVLPKTLDEAGFKRQVFAAIYANNDLLKCEPVSVLMAVMEAASFGLRVASHLGEGHLLPFKNKQTGVTIAKFVPDYKGLVRLARRNNSTISQIYAYPVFRQDHFKVEYGLNHILEHVPCFNHPFDDTDITGAYAVVRYHDGGYDWVYWPISRILSHRDKYSQSYRSNPATSQWTKGFQACVCKTMLKQLSKFVDISEEARRAVAIDDEIEDGFEATTDIPITVDPLTVPAEPVIVETPAPDPNQAPAEPGPKPVNNPRTPFGTNESAQPKRTKKQQAAAEGSQVAKEVRRAREEAIDAPGAVETPARTVSSPTSTEEPVFEGPSVEITMDDIPF